MTTQTDDGRLRLTILGGYLGSGKTTWLRHQLFEGHFPAAHILVNEAALTPVDDTLLAAQAASMTLLVGGCACCTGKEDLIAALRALCDTRSRQSAKARGSNHIILETSGLADPAAILTAIQSDGVLVHHIRAVQTIVLVDALHAVKQLHSEHLSRAQIEAADRIILTKVDTVTDPTLAAVKSTVKQLNPGAKIEAAAKGLAVCLPNLPEAKAYALPLLSDGTAPILPTRIEIPPDVDWATFSVWLSALLYARGDDLVRVKGVFDTPAGPLLLQAVRKSVQPPERLPTADHDHRNQIVFIGRGYESEDLRNSLAYFRGKSSATI
ncbi:GTP-binding protein [Phaeobacter sp. B1627]|uniref:CobW family GTP-binding protein n=1 Tax=Phaeobacter sp. B1627 TaxID=2583809 RepID=UPI00111A789C|nr:CobW family GTP-binding protein [Phaeobacter sp. B1627]TNJ46818.1 GTP-binding protein [Phaeobacter sp. B1627]